ncbi:hypothetical protein GQ44DRAFT_722818 [Phaeosphaeriaceae sp. PMI808]|nr:hypothetical protein GQ44DRAFT_722818 [Phaeosphaeriaceae sp. PMI808]
MASSMVFSCSLAVWGDHGLALVCLGEDGLGSDTNNEKGIAHRLFADQRSEGGLATESREMVARPGQTRQQKVANEDWDWGEGVQTTVVHEARGGLERLGSAQQ